MTKRLFDPDHIPCPAGCSPPRFGWYVNTAEIVRGSALLVFLVVGCAAGMREHPRPERQNVAIAETANAKAERAEAEGERPGTSRETTESTNDSPSACPPEMSQTPTSLRIIEVDLAPGSSHFIARGLVFQTTCFSLDRNDKLVLPGMPTQPGVRIAVVVIDDERECSATLLACERTSIVVPANFKEEGDGRIVLTDGTEWSTAAYVSEGYHSDVYICPSQGELVVDDEVINVVRVR